MEDKFYAVIDTNVIISAVESFNRAKIWHLFCNQVAKSLQSAWGIYHRKDSAFSAVAAFAATAFVFFQESADSIHNEGKHREAHEQSRQNASRDTAECVVSRAAPPSTCSVATTLSLARKPEIRAVTTLQSPRPIGAKSGYFQFRYLSIGTNSFPIFIK